MASAAFVEGVALGGRWLPKRELDSRLRALTAEYEREQPFFERDERSQLGPALAFYREQEQRDPNAFVFREEEMNSLTVLYGTGGNHTAAREVAQLCLEEYPESWIAWVRLAETQLALEDPEAARKSYEQAHRLRSDAPLLAQTLARLRAEYGD